MFETWTAFEITGFLMVVFIMLAFLFTVVFPPLYAYVDRWLDRTRNEITDRVDSSKED